MKYFIFRLIPIILWFQSIAPLEEFGKPETAENLAKKTAITAARAKAFSERRPYQPESLRSNNSNMPSVDSIGYSSAKSKGSENSLKSQTKLTFEDKITPIAQKANAHHNFDFIKTAHTKNYVDRATELSKNVQDLLTDKTLLDSITKGDSAAINTYKVALDKAIDQQKKYANFWIFGKRSNALIKDLQNLRDSLKTATRETPSFAEDAQEKIRKAEQDLQKRFDQAQAKSQAEADKRTQNIQKAPPASAQDYINNAKISIDPATGRSILDTSQAEMTDARRTALLDTLKTLKAKPATPDIEAEIQKIQQQLADHHKALAKAIGNLYEQNQAAYTHLYGKIENLESQINSNENAHKNNETIKKAQQTLNNLQTKLESLNKQFTQAKSSVQDQLDKQKNIKDRTLQIQELQKKIDALRETSEQAGVAPKLQEIQDNERELARLEQEQNNEKAKNSLEKFFSTSDKQQDVAKEIKDANAKIATLNKQFNDVQKELTQQLTDAKAQKSNIDTDNTKMDLLINYHQEQAQAANPNAQT